ncbi:MULTISPECIES: Fe-S cluster assembly protein HesB [Microbacterium]|uniref:Fe-S cluster assembly protein HesB n=1 Tax=Microbacterium TaxID=33882 RepID=UPI00217D21E3|nr:MULTISPECIES: Fe-S cluster assembly protein HesB [Microbacterium]UWF78095.1 Fe-S cluster assembly protein HesB [Microbacterium neungamense]WCM56273.1 Fe-S cluster assembly protein HesB [Microbacterium sp. EF45047]
MLTLTDNASTIATSIVAQQSADPSAGLLIHTSGTGPADEARFALTVAPAPEPGDDIVEGEGGARVFLEHEASEALADKTLDAGVDEQGAVSFTLLPQPV